jgi:glycosyltransferase involved in cell wall biosynthesis
VYKEHSIGVVIPSHNEENHIKDTIETLPDFIDKIYVVDDGSTDKTAEVVKMLTDERVHLFQHEVNRGPGAAVVTGYEAALNDEMDVIVKMDGDNQMDPEQLPNLLDPIVEGRADYTKGNRLLSPEYRKGMSKWRFFGNSILTFLTKIGSGYWQMIDPQNGYTAISRRVLERINLDSVYPYYGYLNDILVRLNIYGYRVMDIVMPARYGTERSSIKYSKYIVKVSLMLLRNFFWRLKMKYIVFSFHPLILFYMLGIVLTPIGIFGGLFALYYKYVIGGPLFIRGVLSLLLFIIGVQFLLFAMLFDMQVNDRESRSGMWD